MGLLTVSPRRVVGSDNRGFEEEDDGEEVLVRSVGSAPRPAGALAVDPR